MTTTFDTSAHPRITNGEFTDKQQTPPELTFGRTDMSPAMLTLIAAQDIENSAVFGRQSAAVHVLQETLTTAFPTGATAVFEAFDRDNDPLSVHQVLDSKGTVIWDARTSDDDLAGDGANGVARSVGGWYAARASGRFTRTPGGDLSFEFAETSALPE